MTESTEAPPVAENPAPPPEPEERTRKIAVLGSASSSIRFAPFKDPGWEIWACSPANRGAPRIDVWFEFHNVQLKEREGLTEWFDWLAKQPLVFMQQGPTPRFPLAKKYPIEAMIARYGRYWWTSSIAYMMAAALDQKPHTIGIYGVDMAANTEYNQQRLACQFFMLEAVKQGVQVVIPPESDLLEPPPMYGYCESNRQWRKYNARLGGTS